jgi:hypothetical protein
MMALMDNIKLCQSVKCLGRHPLSNKDGVKKIVSGYKFNCPDCGFILVPLKFRRSYIEKKKESYEKIN